MQKLSGTFIALTLAGVILLFISGCGKQENAEKNADGKDYINVVATTGMIGDAVRTIAGDKVKLYTMMGPGVDPHLYKATKEDIDQLDAADIVFYNGLHLEAKLAEILEKMGRTKTVVAIGEAIPDSLRRYPNGSGGQPDPHIWFDFSLWEKAVDTLGFTLGMKIPEYKQEFDNNTRLYCDELLAEHERIKAQIAEIPKERRVLITAHDAFGYFGRAYDIEVEGLQGISTVAEAGLHDVTKLVDYIAERKIKAVFVESSVSPKAIEAVVEGCHSQGHQVVIGGTLYSDALGAADTPEATLIGVMRHNVEAIVNALK